jgi:hypothetical protein
VKTWPANPPREIEVEGFVLEALRAAVVQSEITRATLTAYLQGLGVGDQEYDLEFTAKLVRKETSSNGT